MKIKVRKGLKEDLSSALELIKELADYENSLQEVSITLEDLENDGFGTHPWYWFLVAENNEKIIITMCAFDVLLWGDEYRKR